MLKKEGITPEEQKQLDAIEAALDGIENAIEQKKTEINGAREQLKLARKKGKEISGDQPLIYDDAIVATDDVATQFLSDHTSSEEEVDCQRTKVWDTGSPVQNADGSWTVKRSIYIDPECIGEELEIVHTNVHGRISRGRIAKITDGIYDSFQGKSIWQSTAQARNLRSRGGGTINFDVIWTAPAPTISLGVPLARSSSLGSHFIPDNNPRHWDISAGWSFNSQQIYIDIINSLNANSSFITTITLDVSFDCGEWEVGVNCDSRANNFYNNIIDDFYRISNPRLQINRSVFRRGRVTGFNTNGGPANTRVQLTPQ